MPLLQYLVGQRIALKVPAYFQNFQADCIFPMTLFQMLILLMTVSATLCENST